MSITGENTRGDGRENTEGDGRRVKGEKRLDSGIRDSGFEFSGLGVRLKSRLCSEGGCIQGRMGA